MPSADWFADSLEYTGPAIARFTSPAGEVRGQGRLVITPYRELSCTLDCESLRSDVEPDFGWMQFLEGGPTIIDDHGRKTYSPHLRSNTCVSLEIATADGGVYRAAPPIYFNYTVNLAGSGGAQLRFHVPRSELVAQQDVAPHYWVLPLLNYVGEATDAGSPIDSHPLRLWRPASESSSEGGASAITRWRLEGWAKNRIVAFTWRDRLAFIEGVADFDRRVEHLRNGARQHLVTAVMIGELQSPHEAGEAANCEMLDLIAALSLATGTQVQAPWLELRAASGALVRRIHLGTFASPFHRATPYVRAGLGALLTCMPASPHFATPAFRACVRHLLQADLDGSPMEDRVDHLARALELLCRIHGFTASDQYRQGISALAQGRLDHATSMTEQAAQLLEASGDELTAGDPEVLGQVGRQLRRAFSLPLGFGKAVEALARYYKLADSEAVADYYRTSGPRMPKRWDQALSSYRNTVMHRGYFEATRIEEVYRFTLHLRDVLARLLLKMCGYIGPYQPAVAKYAHAEQPVGWVTPDTPVANLGYRID